MDKRKRVFTLVEIMLVLILVGIIATFSIPVYRGVVERSRAEACAVNLEALLAAVETFTMEQNTTPGDLSWLREKDFRKAWARIYRRKGYWKVKLTQFVAELDRRGTAYAQWVDTYIGNIARYRCPSAPQGLGMTYGLNPAVANLPFGTYQNLGANVPVIYDADGRGNPVSRHRDVAFFGTGSAYVQGINRNGEVLVSQSGTRWQLKSDDDGDDDGPKDGDDLDD
ncbi:MAG: hypothetical protein GF333_02760 [Candidatus Omnitrophica bacterium]|nr:hypothetical protein [Candidatus Omnitrophota bacterium]